MIDIYHYYKLMEKGHVMLLFKGFISTDLMSSILQITESKLEKIQEQPKIKKKVFNVLVECLQNVYHHYDDRQTDGTDFNNVNSSILAIGKESGNYFIITGNYLLHERVDGLQEKIDELNKMSRDEVKELYHKKLSDEGFSEKGGAGLGLIDIRRKSGQQLEYNFQEVGDGYSFFTLKVTIQNNT